MEFSIGFVCRDFVLVAADTASARSIVMFKQDEDKTTVLGKNVVMSVNGESGDCVQFAEYIQKNIQLSKIRNGYELSPSEMVNFTRKALAEALRSDPYFVNLLIGGFDAETGGSLHYLDYLASSVSVPFAAHGYGSYFVLSLLDRWHRADLTEEDAVALLKKCMAELKKRFIVTLPAMKIRLVKRDGVTELPVLTEAQYVE